MSTYINSNNDWDTLRKVIVGRIDGSYIPPDEPQYRIKSNGESSNLNWGVLETEIILKRLIFN